MNMFLRNRTRQRSFSRWGFTLLELAIVLGVVGVLSGGLWRLMSAGSQQTKDQAVAAQHAALINSVKGYLADTSTTGGQQWLTKMAAYTAYNLPLPSSNTTLANCQASSATSLTVNLSGLCNYLPTGFSSATANGYGQSYLIQVLKDGTAAGTAPQNYSFMILASATSSTKVPDGDGGRISGLIGGDGGFLYTSASVCTAGAAPAACGALGAWQVPNITTNPNGSSSATGYGFAGANATAGSVASRTFISAATSSSFFWLARVTMPNDATLAYNSMVTDLFMGPWQSANTALSGSAAAPALHLQNSYIDGAGTPNAGIAQIYLHGNYVGPPAMTAPAPMVEISNAPASADLTSTAGCTALNTNGVFAATCPAVLYIPHGDISVPNGEVAAQKVYSASDLRLKMNIHPIEDPLANLMKLGPVAFTFKSTGSQSMGVIAQDLEKVYPQLVLDNGGTKYVEYNGLVGPLIGAVQELKKQNDALRAQLRTQEERLDKLEHKTSAP
jgi:type II secretory pathway pseudopilin PulG